VCRNRKEVRSPWRTSRPCTTTGYCSI